MADDREKALDTLLLRYPSTDGRILSDAVNAGYDAREAEVEALRKQILDMKTKYECDAKKFRPVVESAGIKELKAEIQLLLNLVKIYEVVLTPNKESPL